MSKEEQSVMRNNYLSPGEKIEILNAMTIGPSELLNREYDNKLKAKKIDLFENNSYNKKMIMKELYWKY